MQDSVNYSFPEFIGDFLIFEIANQLPVWMSRVALETLTTQGRPYSRATTAPVGGNKHAVLSENRCIFQLTETTARCSPCGVSFINKHPERTFYKHLTPNSNYCRMLNVFFMSGPVRFPPPQ